MDRLLSEVAVRCDDVKTVDFTPNEYGRALHRANRTVAKRYSLLNKVISFKLSEYSSSLTEDVILDLQDMKAENSVWVNNIKLIKVSRQLVDGWDAYSYYLDYHMNQWHFNYKLGTATAETNIDISNMDITEVMSQALEERAVGTEEGSKSFSDEVVISYNVIPDADTDEGDFIIPSMYEEEQIEEAVLYLAKLGVTRFKEDKLHKYERLLKLYLKSDDYNKFNVPSREWVEIKPYIFP